MVSNIGRFQLCIGNIVSGFEYQYDIDLIISTDIGADISDIDTKKPLADTNAKILNHG